MSKHTPGPWRSYPCNLEKYSQVITAKGAMVQVAITGLNHHDQVAMTKEVYGDRTTYAPGEETMANARLIAAAPGLLESLKACLQCFAEMTGRKPGFVEDSIAMSKEAITKATGDTA